MPIVEVVDGLIELINQNIIAKTNVVSDVTTGDVLIEVENSFHFEPKQEIVLIDNGYNVEGDEHFEIFEYARVKEVNNTHFITLESEIISNWTVANASFVQKTIGHSPLYVENVYYGDREVVPVDKIAVAVEPIGLTNEWIWIQGGLSEEYRVDILVYAKEVTTEEGMKILNKYSDAIYKLMIQNLHIDIDNSSTPILRDVSVGDTVVVIEDTPDNRENFKVDPVSPADVRRIELQDNKNVELDRAVLGNSFSGDEMSVTLDSPFTKSYSLAEFGALIRHGRYFYDTRVDNVEWGTTQKGSAILRAARLNWWGKEVAEEIFPQRSKGIPLFTEIEPGSPSSSSSDSS